MTPVDELLTEKIKTAALALENFVLRGQAEVQRLQGIRDSLVEQARESVGAPKEHMFDTESRTFKPREAPKPFSATKRQQLKRVKGVAADAR